ncbi:MAG: ribokinase [Gammaproteobacteria bacterium]|nr:MAG: ribokinase [Gammaproteobacteria bacterium]
MPVYNFGSINIDHVYRLPHIVRPGETLASTALDMVLGGKGANQSVALARAGVTVRHLGRVSRDDAWAIDALAASGVDVSLIEAVAGVSGHAIIQVDDGGENAIVLHGGANRGFDRHFLEAGLSEAGEGDWLLLQNECDELATAMSVAFERGLAVAFNPAPFSSLVGSLPLEKVAVLWVNETEASELGGVDDPLVALAALGERLPATRVVLTRGAAGVVQLHRGERIDVAAPTVDVVDTTGAGDTFAGYHLAGICQGLDDGVALERAVAAAALAVTKAGASPAIPLAAAVDSFLR